MRYLPTYLCDNSFRSDSSDSSEWWEKSRNPSTKKHTTLEIFFFFTFSVFLERATWHIWQPMWCILGSALRFLRCFDYLTIAMYLCYNKDLLIV